MQAQQEKSVRVRARTIVRLPQTLPSQLAFMPGASRTGIDNAHPLPLRVRSCFPESFLHNILNQLSNSKMASHIAIRWPLPSPNVQSGSFLPASDAAGYFVPAPIPSWRAQSCRRLNAENSLSEDFPFVSRRERLCPVRRRPIVKSQSSLGPGLIQAASHSHNPTSSVDSQQASKKRIAVFVSGGGSNYKAIQGAIDAGEVNGEVVVVVSDKPGM